jgi:hypothetical protein
LQEFCRDLGFTGRWSTDFRINSRGEVIDQPVVPGMSNNLPENFVPVERITRAARYDS